MTDISVRPIGIMRGLPGSMQGPTVAIDGDVVTFNGTTGALVKDSGVHISTLALNSALATEAATRAAADSAEAVARSTGDTAAIATAAAAANAALVAALAALPGRNAVINGNMAVAQRATSFAIPASGVYTLDRWRVSYDGAIGTFAVSQGTFAVGLPAGRERRNYLRWDHTVAGSGSTFRQLQQRIRDVKTFAGQTVTVSFYAAADAARAVSVSLNQGFGTGGAPSADVANAFGTANLTTAPTRFQFTAALADLTGKTLGSNGDDCLKLQFGLPLNVVMTIDIWDVQVEIGTAASQYERKGFDRELADCLPYYEKSFPYAIAPAQNAGTTGAHTGAQGVAGALATNLPGVKFSVRKRATPTITLFNPSAANAQVRNTTQPSDMTVSTATVIGDGGFGISATGAAASTVGQQCAVHWTAEAEL